MFGFLKKKKPAIKGEQALSTWGTPQATSPPPSKGAGKTPGLSLAVFASAKSSQEQSRILDYARNLASKPERHRLDIAGIGSEDETFVQLLFDRKRLSASDVAPMAEMVCAEISERVQPTLQPGDYTGVAYSTPEGHNVELLLLPEGPGGRLKLERVELDAAGKLVKPAGA
ncbi:MAG: hypothetical protein KF866_03885 [Phycisphaeraceae bacterium]|nr:hypothetical protein [Phycisphaeraceae bacterium]